jgi:hypothetical protein
VAHRLGWGFVVQGLGFGVWGLGFGVWGLGFGVWGLGFGVRGLGFRIGDLCLFSRFCLCLGLMVQGLGSVWSLGFRDWGSWCEVEAPFTGETRGAAIEPQPWKRCTGAPRSSESPNPLGPP